MMHLLRNDVSKQTNKDKRISECLRDELEAHFGVGPRDPVGSKPFQAITEDHLQLHRQPHRNIHEPAHLASSGSARLSAGTCCNSPLQQNTIMQNTSADSRASRQHKDIKKVEKTPQRNK